MADLSYFGKSLMLLGAFLFGIGFLISFAGKIFSFGRLPGDIFIQKGNFTFYFPIVTSLLLSIVLTIILNIFTKK